MLRELYDKAGYEGTIKLMLDVAEERGILKRVFVTVQELHLSKRLKKTLETLKNQEQNEEQKTKIDGWLEILAKSTSSCRSNEEPLAPESNTSKIENSDQKDTVNTTNKSIIIGSVCVAIALLAVGGGCFATGVALPILAIAGIAVAAALVIGAIAGGISHVVLRPSDDECLSKPQKSVVNSPKSQNEVQSQISDQEPKITIPQYLTEENPKESVSQADTNAKLTENSLNNGSETITTDQQGNNIVINGIFIPEGAKLKCFPELSNFLSKASLEGEKLLCKVVPNSLLFQSREERIAINGQSVDAQSLQ